MKDADNHIHKYTKQAYKKVPLIAGTKTAVDTIKYQLCVEVVNGKVCGHKVAYDLERTL